MTPKIIWQKGSRRIVAEMIDGFGLKVHFEIKDGEDALRKDRWISLDELDYPHHEFLEAVALDLAEKNYP